MSKLDSDKIEIENFRQLGEKNKLLLPQVRNWCKNLVIEDVSAGMIAEYYSLPTTLRISCPHATGGSESANFEWIASAFIIEHCQACKFHEEVHQNNFGRDTIDKQLKQDEALKQAQIVESERKRALRLEISCLIESEEARGEITKLSVLKLIQSLDHEENKDSIAEKIVEASKLEPLFFSDVALNVLSLSFDNPNLGKKILQAAKNVLGNCRELPSFAFERLILAIENGLNIDEAVGLLHSAIEDKNYREYDNTINCIIDSLHYYQQIYGFYGTRRTYPNTIQFLYDLYIKDEAYVYKLLKERISYSDKIERINTNYLLQALIEVNPEIVRPHVVAIIKSLEFYESSYDESADKATCKTLSKLYNSFPEYVLKEIDNAYPTLSLGAEIELSSFFEIILVNEHDVPEHEEHINKVVRRVVQILVAKENSRELKKKIIERVEDISHRRPSLFINHFDSLTDFFIEQVQSLKTFDWYLKELDKPQDKISTFNPLQGQHLLELDNQKMELERNVRMTKKIIEHIIKGCGSTDIPRRILDKILNLDSSTNENLKCDLIDTLAQSVKDPIQLAELLPHLYKFLLDPQSEIIRWHGINFLKHLIEENDRIVTQTLIDLVKVFMEDTSRIIKSVAIKTYGSLLRKFPDQLDEKSIRIILDGISDPYVIVHKDAVVAAPKLAPLLNDNQKLFLIDRLYCLMNLYYHNRGKSYRELRYGWEICETLLSITKNTSYYTYIVKDCLLKYCTVDDSLTVRDAIRKLTQIRGEFVEFNELWLQQIITFLANTELSYDTVDSGIREDIFSTMYSLSQEVFLQNKDSIDNLLHQKIDKGEYFDVFQLYNVLAYFNLHKQLYESSSYFIRVVEANKSNQSSIERNNVYNRIANVEVVIAEGRIDDKFITSINSL